MLTNAGLKQWIKKILKHILSAINACGKSLSKLFEAGIIEIVNVKSYNGHSYCVLLFGKEIANICKNHANYANNGRPTFYFTVNKMEDYTRISVQQWVDIAYELDSDFYFICDNKKLKSFLLRNIIFPNNSVKFIPSMRRKLKKICQTISTKSWEKAACAHLTSFYHAKQNNIKKFWKIDADDTYLCMSPQKASEVLKKVESLAEKREMPVISLDMWHSRTKGKHWSWGIAYIDGEYDFISLIEAEKNLSWVDSGPYPFKTGVGEVNVDWFFTYLKICKGVNCGTFYIENAYMVHWGNFLQYPSMVAALYFWSTEKLLYPIFRYLYEDEKNGFIDLAADCEKIDIGLSQKEGLRFLHHHMKM